MGKPKPFSRPSISISTGATGAKKEWRDVSPREVEVGDLILGKGLVVGVGDVYRTQDPARYFFEFEMKNGTTHQIEGEIDWSADHFHEVSFLPTVRAFVKVRG